MAGDRARAGNVPPGHGDARETRWDRVPPCLNSGEELTMRTEQLRRIPIRLPLALGLAALGAWLALAAGSSSGPSALVGYQEGELELDVRSKYSHIKVTRENNLRTLWFVRDSGEEVVESIVDLN